MGIRFLTRRPRQQASAITLAFSPETTIVIRALNEERWLPEVLDAVHRQTYRDFEVLLVDSGSLESEPARSRRRAVARIIRLRSEDFTFGIPRSRHPGSEGRFIVIISAHAIPTDAQWLERLVAPPSARDRHGLWGTAGARGLQSFRKP